MPQRPDRHARPKLELRLSLPRLDVRRIPTGAQPPAPGSRTGSTGTPRHNVRCPDALWGAAIAAEHARGRELSGTVRGYLVQVAAGTAPIYPDPMAEDDAEG